MPGSARGAWCGQLLLFTALLFGLFTMHTLGHPTGAHGAGHESAAVSATAPASMTTGSFGTAPASTPTGSFGTASVSTAPGSSESVGAAHEDTASFHVAPAGPAHERTAPAAPPAPASASGHEPSDGTLSVTATPPTGSPAPDGGMDPLAVCLAVLLGAFTLVLLVSAGPRQRPAALRAPVRASLLRALWPSPIPPRTLLSRLSVLRL